MDIQQRLSEGPGVSGELRQPAGNGRSGCAGSTTALMQSPKRRCKCLDISNKGDDPNTLMDNVKDYEVSLDRKKILIRKDNDFYIVDSDAKGEGLGDPKVLGKTKIDFTHWEFSTTPQAEFRGIFLDAWRLERDYF